MAIYSSESEYIQSATTDSDKIVKIDTAISNLYDVVLTAVANEDVQEYSMDNGQTKIRKVYRSVKAVMQTIKALETMKTHYSNKLNGGIYNLQHKHTI